jgi:hypothetical protein
VIKWLLTLWVSLLTSAEAAWIDIINPYRDELKITLEQGSKRQAVGLSILNETDKKLDVSFRLTRGMIVFSAKYPETSYGHTALWPRSSAVLYVPVDTSSFEVIRLSSIEGSCLDRKLHASGEPPTRAEATGSCPLTSKDRRAPAGPESKSRCEPSPL